jgi:G3E family GTPase
MKLIAVTGMAVAPKERLVTQLVQQHTAKGETVTLLDNGDRRLRLDAVPTVRLPAGCVCCSLASQLLRAARSAQTDVIVLLVSALADPATLAYIISMLSATGWAVTTVAFVDEPTRARFPHLAEQLTLHADYTLDESGMTR